jgi:hypothetical protein
LHLRLTKPGAREHSGTECRPGLIPTGRGQRYT